MTQIFGQLLDKFEEENNLESFTIPIKIGIDFFGICIDSKKAEKYPNYDTCTVISDDLYYMIRQYWSKLYITTKNGTKAFKVPILPRSLIDYSDYSIVTPPLGSKVEIKVYNSDLATLLRLSL